MYLRLFLLVLVQAAAAALGWHFAPAGEERVGALFSAGMAGYVWLLVHYSRGLRLLRWLRSDTQLALTLGGGIWGEAAERMRRLLRSRDRLVAQSDTRLQDFLAAMQASPNGVILLDGQGQIEWLNQTAASHFGLDAQRDLMQHLTNLVRDPGFNAYFSGGDFATGVTMPGRDHSLTKPVRLAVHLHPYGEGRRLLLSRDITAVEQAEAMRRDFVANVSHEIRTPLTVLAGFVETLQTLAVDAQEQQRYLGLMAQQSQRMQTLVNDLLTLSRLEGSPPPGTQEWVSVRELLTQCAQEGQQLSELLWHSTHDLQVEVQGDAYLAGASGELYSALFNLVGNAIRYTPARQRIEVCWQSRGDGGGVFSVKDSGVGIAAEHLPRLTERFYRVDRSRSRETGGTGLGLAIVKHVAQRHGAELQIASVLGQGSTFSINFPPSRVRHQAVAA
ncbi:MAG: phosphate regulon sensor histidine kinase PhoR [Rhodoferax sp.]